MPRESPVGPLDMQCNTRSIEGTGGRCPADDAGRVPRIGSLDHEILLVAVAMGLFHAVLARELGVHLVERGLVEAPFLDARVLGPVEHGGEEVRYVELHHGHAVRERVTEGGDHFHVVGELTEP